MIKLDGNYGEGGGQIVRTALAFSTITQIPFEITSIRSGREKPGLKAQHLTCIKALAKLCDAKADGAELGSSFLRYWPGKIKGKTINIDIGTAGSITLLLQSLLIPCFFADKTVRLHLKGGTNVAWSMPIEYFEQVFAQNIAKYCEKFKIKLNKRGYYPAGNGEVDITIKPKFKLAAYPEFSLFWKELQNQNNGLSSTDQYNLMQIKGVSHASKDLEKAEVAERQAKAARQMLARYNVPISIIPEYCSTLSTGSGITLWAIFSKSKDDIDILNPIRLGADALGERGKSSEEVGQEAAKALISQIESKAPVDKHLADNLVPFMALFCPSKIRASELTGHTLTNMYVVEQFLGKIFEINEKEKVISSKCG